MRAVAALCVAVIACSHSASRAPGGPGWVELETDHFVLQADLPLDEARAVARELEEVRAALIAGSWHGNKLRGDKIRVVELADHAELREFTPREVAGFFAAQALLGEQLVVMSAEQSPSQQPILKHELGHQLQASFLLRSKPWLREGLACYVATLRYDHAQERWVLGDPDEERVSYLAEHPDTDLGHVLTATPEEFDKLDLEQMQAFYAASWLVVFHLANERRADLDDYLQRLANAEDPNAAFAASFQASSPDQLARELAKYQSTVLFRQIGLGQRVASFGVVKLNVPRWSGAIESRRLGDADVAAIRGELFLLSYGGGNDWDTRVGHAKAEADRALAVDPTHPLALAVRRATQGRATKAMIEDLRAATRARPQDPRVWRLLGESLPNADSPERRAALEKAVALAPDDAVALEALAWDHLRGGRGPEAVAIAVRAVTLFPGRASALDALGTALATTGRCEDAVKTEERAVELMTENAWAATRSAAVSRLHAFRAGCHDVPLK